MTKYKPIMEEALEEVRRSGKLKIQERVFGLEHARLLQQGWRLAPDGTYRKGEKLKEK